MLTLSFLMLVLTFVSLDHIIIASNLCFMSVCHLEHMNYATYEYQVLINTIIHISTTELTLRIKKNKELLLTMPTILRMI